MSGRDGDGPERARGLVEGGIHRIDEPRSPRVVRADETPRTESSGRERAHGDGDRGAGPGSSGESQSDAATDPAGALMPDSDRAVVVCVANQKGGVGKTTTAVSLAAALADQGVEVLIVDLDPQANATTGLGLRVAEGAPSTYRVLIERMPVEDATEPAGIRGLFVVPSNLDLAGAEIELVSEFGRESRLRDGLEAVTDLYDVVLVDCPPSLGLLTINGLVAADQVLVPVQCEYYALEGLGQLLETIRRVGERLNPGLELGGVVLTMYDARTNLSSQVADEVREYFGDLAFRTVVPRTVRLGEAPGYGEPIEVFAPSSRGARCYRRLARELGERLGLRGDGEGTSADALDLLLGGAPDEERRQTDQVGTESTDGDGRA